MSINYYQDLITELDKMINKKEAKLKALEQSVTLDPIQNHLIIIQKDSINASLETLKTHKINYNGMLNDELLRRCCGCKICKLFVF